jgi:hypothetical protein
MRKPALVILLLIIPLLLIIAGSYFAIDMLISIGCILLIFYVIIAIRERFSAGKENKQE